MAAIVDTFSPIPILITHPTLVGSLSSNGGPTITICGGPSRSVQVNSNNTTPNAVAMNSNATVDLRHAGPKDTGNCTTGTGADFGTFGFPVAPTFTFNPGVGKYVQPSSPVTDPLAGVLPPAVPAIVDPPVTVIASGTSDANGNLCSTVKDCSEYSPGSYSQGILAKGDLAFFKPGIYYMATGGFRDAAGSDLRMAKGFANDLATGQGMLIYDTGVANAKKDSGFQVGANGSVSLAGSGCSAITLLCDVNNIYKSVLTFENHSAPSITHKFGGGGALTLIGTIYITNTKAGMLASPAIYQTVLLRGNPGSGTLIQGEIIASTLDIGGNAGITMNLSPLPTFVVRQVALVK